jgi:hypothetical protein
MAELVHVAGPVVTVNERQRQRCAWCGTLLLDYDLKNIAVQIPDDGSPPPPPATWPVGAQVAVDGVASWEVLQTKDPLLLPDNSCVELDPAVTA